jgi:hypothetical protein
MTEVTQPIFLKDGALFLGTYPNGAVPGGSDAGVGLFHRDIRYLSRYALTLGERDPLVLMSSAARGTQAIHQLTNDEIVQTDGKSMAPQCFGLRLDRTVAGDRLELADRIEIRNFALKPIRFELAVTIDALFEDIFELRGAEPKSRGPLRTVETRDDGLTFRYIGTDAVERRLTVMLDRAATITVHGSARRLAFDLEIKARQTETLEIRFEVEEVGAPTRASPPCWLRSARLWRPASSPMRSILSCISAGGMKDVASMPYSGSMPTPPADTHAQLLSSAEAQSPEIVLNPRRPNLPFSIISERECRIPGEPRLSASGGSARYGRGASRRRGFRRRQLDEGRR